MENFKFMVHCIADTTVPQGNFASIQTRSTAVLHKRCKKKGNVDIAPVTLFSDTTAFSIGLK
jgi:hypothetical protein